MTEFEAMVAIVGVIAVFGTGTYIMHSIFKLIRYKIDKKNSTLDPDLLKDLKEFKSFKQRTENRLQAIEHIITDDQAAESQPFIELDDEVPAKESPAMKSKLKNQLKS